MCCSAHVASFFKVDTANIKKRKRKPKYQIKNYIKNQYTFVNIPNYLGQIVEAPNLINSLFF